MRLFGLIGYPLSHSLSKNYFTDKFHRENLEHCQFENFSISSIEELPGVLQNNPTLEGLAVTIPYKQKVISYLDSTANLPATLQACNCIQLREGKLIGYNTDHIGFEKSILPFLKPHHKRALLLGNGGATMAIAYVLKKLNIRFDIVSRSLREGSSLTYKNIDGKKIKDNLVIINATPTGTFPNIDECPDIPYEFITPQHLLYDLVYNPAKTLFLQKGEERGATIVNGESMLHLQAEENWKIWNDLV